MSERLTADISHDLRASAQDMRAEHRNTDAGLLTEAADKLDGLIALLAEAEAERDRLGDKANELVQALKATRNNRLVSAIFGHHKDAPRPFALYRRSVTGVSGTGIVGEGAAFSDGTAVLRWLSDGPTSVVFHDRGVEAIEAVHGNDGAIQVVWLSDELEPLAEMEAERDRLAVELAEVRAALTDGLTGYERDRLTKPGAVAPYIRALRDALLATTGASSRLAETVQRVWELHAPTLGERDTKWCSVCSQDEEQPQPTGWWVPWPCPTIAALDGAQLPEAGEPGSNLGADDPIETGTEAALGEAETKLRRYEPQRDDDLAEIDTTETWPGLPTPGLHLVDPADLNHCVRCGGLTFLPDCPGEPAGTETGDADG